MIWTLVEERHGRRQLFLWVVCICINLDDVFLMLQRVNGGTCSSGLHPVTLLYVMLIS